MNSGGEVVLVSAVRTEDPPLGIPNDDIEVYFTGDVTGSNFEFPNSNSNEEWVTLSEIARLNEEIYDKPMDVLVCHMYRKRCAEFGSYGTTDRSPYQFVGSGAGVVGMVGEHLRQCIIFYYSSTPHYKSCSQSVKWILPFSFSHLQQVFELGRVNHVAKIKEGGCFFRITLSLKFTRISPESDQTETRGFDPPVRSVLVPSERRSEGGAATWRM